MNIMVPDSNTLLNSAVSGAVTGVSALASYGVLQAGKALGRHLLAKAKIVKSKKGVKTDA